MADVKSAANPSFLREEERRQGIELLYYAYRDFTAEHDARLRDLLRRYLADQGFRVTTAGDAAEARQKLAGMTFDLLVLDVMMPGEDGFDLTKSLRESSRIPILLLTARAETTDRIAGLERGADDYLVKPFEPRELVLRIRNILQRVAAEPESAAAELRLGDYRLDLKRGELMRGGAAVKLTGADNDSQLADACQACETLPRCRRQTDGTRIEESRARAVAERVGLPFEISGDLDPRDILVSIQTGDGVMQIAVPRERLFTPTTYIFIMWMVGSSLVLFAIASVFLRNQIKSLKRLAAAADAFGKGREVPNFRLEGATEVRQVGMAFLKMRERIQRSITQRTEMLAGVSHDLRTPLTRMRLALELQPSGPTAAELKDDLAAMERMVQGYIDFA